MKFDGILLYGPPASGKDTITRELLRLTSAYVLFEKIKVGSGRRSGYRNSSIEELEALRAANQIIYENRRYGNTYVVDGLEIHRVLNCGGIPVIHLGQIEGVQSIRGWGLSWLAVLLWCSRATCQERLQQRAAQDIDARIAAWSETVTDLGDQRLGVFDLFIPTDGMDATTSAKLIDRILRG